MPTTTLEAGEEIQKDLRQAIIDALEDANVDPPLEGLRRILLASLKQRRGQDVAVDRVDLPVSRGRRTKDKKDSEATHAMEESEEEAWMTE